MTLTGVWAGAADCLGRDHGSADRASVSIAFLFVDQIGVRRCVWLCWSAGHRIRECAFPWQRRGQVVRREPGDAPVGVVEQPANAFVVGEAGVAEDRVDEFHGVRDPFRGPQHVGVDQVPALRGSRMCAPCRIEPELRPGRGHAIEECRLELRRQSSRSNSFIAR